MGTWAGALLCSFLPGGSGFCEAGAGRRQLAAEEDAIRVGGLARVPGCPRSGSGRSELVGPLRTGDVLSHWDRALPPVIPTSMRRLLGGWGAFPLQSHPASPTQRAGWSPLVGPPTRSPSVPEGSQTAVLGLRLHRVGGRVCAEQPPSLGEGRFPVCETHIQMCRPGDGAWEFSTWNCESGFLGRVSVSVPGGAWERPFSGNVWCVETMRRGKEDAGASHPPPGSLRIQPGTWQHQGGRGPAFLRHSPTPAPSGMCPTDQELGILQLRGKPGAGLDRGWRKPGSIISLKENASPSSWPLPKLVSPALPRVLVDRGELALAPVQGLGGGPGTTRHLMSVWGSPHWGNSKGLGESECQAPAGTTS